MSNTPFSLSQFYTQVKSKVNFTDTTPNLTGFSTTDNTGASTERMRLTTVGLGINNLSPSYLLDGR